MLEIERKFLVKNDKWRGRVSHFYSVKQAYLPSRNGVVVRIRVIDDAKALLTIKGPMVGISRPEYEYNIPVNEAKEMMAYTDRPVIEKSRSEVSEGNHLWEVDEFEGDNEGLILAEIELESEDGSFEIPDWLGVEVTHDPRYSNGKLAKTPFKTWPENNKP
jgi:adenylate cyclase